MTNVAGVFKSEIQANRAITELMDSGFERKDISLLISEKGRSSFFSSSGSSYSSSNMDTDNKAARGAAGALFGGALGALIGGLAAVGSIVIPGSGLLAAGPIVAALSGAGAGAAAGGFVGALVNAGFSSDEARRFEEEIKRGNAVVVVDAPEELVREARTIMHHHEGAARVA